jgi:hypothetical protein
LIHAVDKFILLDDVNFINKGWINRNNILVNERKYLFTIPLQKRSQNKLISDIKVMEEPKWKESFLKTIMFAYKKTMFYPTVFQLLGDILAYEDKNISNLAFYSLKNILNYLKLDDVKIIRSTTYNNKSLSGQSRIIDICLQEKACSYLNPIGGKNLYQKNAFEKENLDLKFLRPIYGVYNQNYPGFLPGLSIIDVLMHNSPEQVVQLLNLYVLENAEKSKS